MIRDWPLIGRADELEQIMAVSHIGDGAIPGVVLSGAAGVGKTRLAAEAVASFRPRDARRRWVIGTASGRDVPLGAFADVDVDFGPDPIHRVRELIDVLVGGRPARRAVVGVDDAHLLDDLSAFAVHQLVTQRLATVILTIRSGESPPDAITALWKDHHLERLELQPLPVKDTADLLENVLGGPVESLSARRLWQFTQGNMLYLRHLVDSELGDGRIVQHSGVWVWQGNPKLPSTLVDLIRARVDQAPAVVQDVLDVLAAAEPLEADLVETITDSGALAEAESCGLVTVDTSTRPPIVRLAHPIFGEVGRTRSLQMQRLRGCIATELGRSATTNPQHLVRRAVLTADSDLTPDPRLLVDASSAAMQLHDLRLAETLAERAVFAGGGAEAKIAQAVSIIWQARAPEAEAILGELAAEMSGPVSPQIAVLRAMNFEMMGQLANAENALAEGFYAADDTAPPTLDACRVWIDVMRGQPAAAVDRLGSVAMDFVVNPIALSAAVCAAVAAFGDLGCIDEVESAIHRGYRFAGQSAEFAPTRFILADLHARALRLAGSLAVLESTAAQVLCTTGVVPFEQAWHTHLAAMLAMSRGALADAQRLCRESLANLGAADAGWSMKTFTRSWLTTATAMAGRGADARREFLAIKWGESADPDVRLWDSEKSIAEAWVCAAEGATSQAVAIAREAAERERGLNRPAVEVLLLQTATQFGDHTTAERLAALAGQVQGPRAPAAAAHAAALAAGDGRGLVDASHRYEAFGDHLAAADAAAQAVLVYQEAGLRGRALTIAATVLRLKDKCQGADSPAMRAATTPLPFTTRQHEIVALAARGLSNQQIADRLSVSKRSVEGHLFRASQRAGVNSRSQLIALTRGDESA